jgi:CO/xanthine dehydrogenase Mo-binding subunit
MLSAAPAAGRKSRIIIRGKHRRTDQRKAEQSHQKYCTDAAHWHYSTPQNAKTKMQAVGRTGSRRAIACCASANPGRVSIRLDQLPNDLLAEAFACDAVFAEVQVDLETGKYQITDFLAVADVGDGDPFASAGRPGAGPVNSGNCPRDRSKGGRLETPGTEMRSLDPRR